MGNRQFPANWSIYPGSSVAKFPARGGGYSGFTGGIDGRLAPPLPEHPQFPFGRLETIEHAHDVTDQAQADVFICSQVLDLPHATDHRPIKLEIFRCTFTGGVNDPGPDEFDDHLGMHAAEFRCATEIEVILGRLADNDDGVAW